MYWNKPSKAKLIHGNKVIGVFPNSQPVIATWNNIAERWMIPELSSVKYGVYEYVMHSEPHDNLIEWAYLPKKHTTRTKK